MKSIRLVPLFLFSALIFNESHTTYGENAINHTNSSEVCEIEFKTKTGRFWVCVGILCWPGRDLREARDAA
jgi:hypothetical protein